MNASFFAVKALKLYGEANDSKKVQEMKKLSIVYTKKSEEEMQSHEITVPLDDELITFLETMVNDLTASNALIENLEKIVN
ncbi:MAG: hypothetical protein JWP13_594, partial [Candidatus Saccharibacteria bacterium]|nr:hypothetical protein [Candidatus Saccharibacteria bacterium]